MQNHKRGLCKMKWIDILQQGYFAGDDFHFGDFMFGSVMALVISGVFLVLLK